MPTAPAKAVPMEFVKLASVVVVSPANIPALSLTRIVPQPLAPPADAMNWFSIMIIAQYAAAMDSPLENYVRQTLIVNRPTESVQINCVTIPPYPKDYPNCALLPINAVRLTIASINDANPIRRIVATLSDNPALLCTNAQVAMIAIEGQ